VPVALRCKASMVTCMENKDMPIGNHKLMVPYDHRLLSSIMWRAMCNPGGPWEQPHQCPRNTRLDCTKLQNMPAWLLNAPAHSPNPLEEHMPARVVVL
jgi:hypothetical protein